MTTAKLDADAEAFAARWFEAQSAGWVVEKRLGRGGTTAPVFMVRGAEGGRALKGLDPEFSEGELRRQTEIRIQRKVDLGDHGCPNLIVCYDGGRIEDRLTVQDHVAEFDGMDIPAIIMPEFRDRVLGPTEPEPNASLEPNGT